MPGISGLISFAAKKAAPPFARAYGKHIPEPLTTLCVLVSHPLASLMSVYTEKCQQLYRARHAFTEGLSDDPGLIVIAVLCSQRPR